MVGGHTTLGMKRFSTVITTESVIQNLVAFAFFFRYSGKGKRVKQGQHEFTVKIFIGVEYECPRGHRFMSSSPGRILKATGAGLVKDSAQLITQNDVPLYLPCPCPYK